MSDYLTQEEIDEEFAPLEYLWEPTGDTLYPESIGGEWSPGIFYERLLIERSNSGWHGSLFVTNSPDEDDERFDYSPVEYDLWPDESEDLFLMVDEEVFSSAEEARRWCETIDQSAHQRTSPKEIE